MKVGFIGLGIMGLSMAKSLQRAGYQLIVHSRRKASAEPLFANGATWADTPKELAELAQVIFTALPGPAEVRDVTLGEAGLLSGAKGGTVYFDLSTNAPALVRELYSELAATGVHMLDAPVSGGRKGAATGKLAIWASGEQEVFEEHKTLLSAMGDRVRYLGPIGNASIAKLVHNCANYGIQMVLAEAFTLGVKAGVEPEILFGAIRQGSLGRQKIVDRLADQFLPSEFDDPAMLLDLAHKDVALATALGRENDVPMKFINLTLAEMTEALNRGWGLKDSRITMMLQEERARASICVARETLNDIIKNEPL